MKVKSFIISGLLTIFSMTEVWASNLDIDDQTSKANLIKLVPAETLKENINKTVGLSHFLEKTRLHTQLGGTTKCPEEINLAIDLAIANYLHGLGGDPSQQNMMKEVMRISKPLLKQAILKSSFQPNQALSK